MIPFRAFLLSGSEYDEEVDSGTTDPKACVAKVAAFLAARLLNSEKPLNEAVQGRNGLTLSTVPCFDAALPEVAAAIQLLEE